MGTDGLGYSPSPTSRTKKLWNAIPKDCKSTAFEISFSSGDPIAVEAIGIIIIKRKNKEINLSFTTASKKSVH